MAKHKPAAAGEAEVAENRVLSLLERMEERMDTIAQRLEKVEAGQPRFQPMRRSNPSGREGGYVRPEELRARAMHGLATDGQEASGGSSLYDRGQQLPRGVQAVFKAGDLVRVNPDAMIHGTVTKAEPNGRMWRSALEAQQLDPEETVGEVKSLTGFSRYDEPKYRVAILGLFQDPARGDGMYESELLPAY